MCTELPPTAFRRFAGIDDGCQVTVLDSDMTEVDQERALRIVLRSVLETTFACDDPAELENRAFVAAAKTVKTNMDNVFRRATPWQVVVGREYGTFVTHESKHFLFVKIGPFWVTVFLSN